VPWVAVFVGKRQDIDLDDKLEREAAGILNWLIKGCLDWQQDGLNEPTGVLAATNEYRAAEDVFQRFADATGLVFEPNLEVSAETLGIAIDEWGRDEGLSHVPSVVERADWLKSRGASNRRRTRDGEKVTVWIGVGFDTGDSEP
jgi:phage/plasmid-associated DNA primase